MKKLSLILVALFTLGFVMAQNSANVSSVGDNNGAYVNQLGVTNTATIDQIGNLNKADVSDHYASTIFGLLTDTKGVTQVGNNNEGTIIQHNQFIPQDGIQAAPEAGIGQFGNHDKATITQTGNQAWLQEYAWAKQEGDYNTSLQNQVSSYAFSSHVWQQGGTQTTGNEVVTVGNKAETQQIGGYSQNASIYQKGDLNDAYIYQGSATAYTENNLAEATQKGDGNKSKQIQNGSNNIAKTQQLSDENTANFYQNGNGNKVIAMQSGGDENVANLTQNGGAQADIKQFGEENILKGIGTDIMATSLNGSTLDLDQLGNGNTLSLQQTNGASATVYQNGSTNTSVVIQN